MNIAEEAAIYGFMVVRMPAMNHYVIKGSMGKVSVPVPRVGELCYGGIDRMAWSDVKESVFDHTAPNHIREAIKAIGQAAGYLLPVCKDLSIAFGLLEYSNRNERRNEVIAVRSEWLCANAGAVLCDQRQMTWCGFDPIAVGSFSLLCEGWFRNPSSLPGWSEYINEYGLLQSREASMNYIAAYERAMQVRSVEEVPGRDLGFDVIEIGRVLPETCGRVETRRGVSG